MHGGLFSRNVKAHFFVKFKRKDKFSIAQEPGKGAEGAAASKLYDKRQSTYSLLNFLFNFSQIKAHLKLFVFLLIETLLLNLLFKAINISNYDLFEHLEHGSHVSLFMDI